MLISGIVYFCPALLNIRQQSEKQIQKQFKAYFIDIN